MSILSTILSMNAEQLLVFCQGNGNAPLMSESEELLAHKYSSSMLALAIVWPDPTLDPYFWAKLAERIPDEVDGVREVYDVFLSPAGVSSGMVLRAVKLMLMKYDAKPGERPSHILHMSQLGIWMWKLLKFVNNLHNLGGRFPAI